MTIKITALQTPFVFEELTEAEMEVIVGGSLLGGLEALVKKAETKLEEEIKKLAGT